MSQGFEAKPFKLRINCCSTALIFFFKLKFERNVKYFVSNEIDRPVGDKINCVYLKSYIFIYLILLNCQNAFMAKRHVTVLNRPNADYGGQCVLTLILRIRLGNIFFRLDNRIYCYYCFAN